jgi:DNA modification methylase
VRAPYVDDHDFLLFVGDAADVLAEMPAGSVDCIVTSPPYWGLRDYGEDGQLGLEPTPQAYVDRLRDIFDGARRVLADTGTLWVNLGDSYSQDTKWGGSSSSKNETEQGYPRRQERGSSGLKPKDLVGIPWRVAFALQDAGWWLRSEIIWHKPNAMPASVTDRPTVAHETVFMLAKSARYFFNQDAVREPYATDDPARGTLNGGGYAPPGQPPHGNARQATLHPDLPPEAPRGPDGRRQTTILGSTPGDGAHENYAGREGAERWPNEGRNVRSVWTIPTYPFAGAHFATFPRELALRCIQAGCPEGGTVLDPFMGSGTTALAARAAGRNAVGIELSEEYAAICAERTNQLTLELAGSDR